MDLFQVNADDFITHCIHRARQQMESTFASSNQATCTDNDRQPTEGDSHHGPSIQVQGDDNITNSSLEYFEPSFSTRDETDSLDTFSSTSCCEQSSLASTEQLLSDEYIEDDISLTSSKSGQAYPAQLSPTDQGLLPKSFLQLKGISVANYNMGCNFSIASSIRLMIQHDLHILAIQEHTPWNRELSDAERSSSQRHCDRWGYILIISKLQIVIIDKQLAASLRDSTISEEGRIIRLNFEVAANQFANFVAVYGYPHSPRNRRRHYIEEAFDENSILQKMRQLKRSLKTIIRKAIDTNQIIYVYGDLQDTPDNSKAFHHGTTNIGKHPLGIAQTCENLGLLCTIYQHMESMPKPIISRHGPKGGRFIDGMY